MGRTKTAKESSSSATLDRIDTSLWEEEQTQEADTGLDRVDTSLWETEAEPEPEPEPQNEVEDIDTRIDLLEQDENIGHLGKLGKDFAKGIKAVDWHYPGQQDPEVSSSDVAKDFAKGISSMGVLGGGGLKLIGIQEEDPSWWQRPLVGIQKAGEAVENYYQERQRELTSEQSPEHLKSKAKKFVRTDETGEERQETIQDMMMDAVDPANQFHPEERSEQWTLGEAFYDPAAISSKVAESFFPSLVGMISGYKYTQFLQKSLGLSPRLSGVIGMGAGESQMYAAGAAHEVYNSVSNASLEDLAESPEYQKLLTTADGQTEEEIAINAKEELATTLAWKSAAKTGALVWAMHIPVGSYVGKLLGGKSTEMVSRSAFKNTFLSSVTELPKSSGAKYFSNMAAIKSYDPERDPMSGVAEAGVAGAVTVAPMGAASGITMNMLGRRGNPEVPSPEEAGSLQPSAQNIRDALKDPQLFTTWKQTLAEVSGKEISDEDFATILNAELSKFEAASTQDAEDKGITSRKDKGKSHRKFRKPKAEREAEGRDAREKLVNAQQRAEGDLGLASDHIVAEADLDLYNRLKNIPEPVFEKMERDETMRQVREGKTVKAAEEILKRRGESLKSPRDRVKEVTTQETQEEVGNTLDKIRPKPETAKVVDQPKMPKGKSEPVVEKKGKAKAKTEPKESLAETHILTSQNKPFKTQAAAKSKRTRMGLKESHEVVEVEGGYAIRPVEEAETQAVETAQVEQEPGRPQENVFEDLELLLEEKSKIEAEGSEANVGEVEGVLETVQSDILQYMEELDPSIRSAFVANNFQLSDMETDQLTSLLDKEAGEGIGQAENTAKNSLLKKMVGLEETTVESLENKGKEPTYEEDVPETMPSFFDDDVQSVTVLKRAYESKSPDQIRENPDVMLGYLTNQLNAWIHGVGDADVGRIRQSLEDVRANQQQFYSHFGSQKNLSEFIEAVDNAIELAERANELKSNGSNPNILRTSFGMEEFYPAAKDIVGRIKNWRGKVNAKSALNRLKKNVSEADMEYLGIDRILNQAAREGRKVSKEEVLEGMTELPEVEVEVRSSDMNAANNGLKMLDRIKIGVDTGDITQEMLKGPMRSRVRASSKVLGISETEAIDYIVDNSPLPRSNKVVRAETESRTSPRYIIHSLLRNENPSYNYEEVLFSIPGSRYQSAFSKHDFSKPVAFFARVARNEDNFVVEEIQSELDAIKEEKNLDIPSPYKTKAWPNIVATTLLKRAKSLGYDTVYMPNYEWVNERWQGQVPKHVKPVYDNIIPRAMDRAGARRLDDEVVKDAMIIPGPIEDIPFQKYRIPKEEPAPQSIPITLNMGFDPTNVVRLAKRAAGKMVGQEGKPNPRAKGATVADMYRETRQDEEKASKEQTSEVKHMLATQLVDVTGPMKSMINKTFGEKKAKQMINRIILAKGHSVRASMFLDRAMKDIYGKLGRKNRERLNEIIFSSRLIQIGRYKGNVTDFKGRTPQQHRDFLNNIEEIYGISEAKALDLFRRAENYFSRMQELLGILREDGLITQEEYNDLYNFRWTRTEAIKKIDPAIGEGQLSVGQSFAQRKSTAAVRDSGIEELEMGSELDTPNIDMEFVLADWTQRVMKRSALAKMNQSLWDLANSDAHNDLVKPSKAGRPKNWSSSEILVDGKKKKIYLHPQFARYWTMEAREISPLAANVVRAVSGSAILRPMATGVRIGFIPVNIARDMILQQYASKYMDSEGNWKPTWNSVVPIGIGQQLFEMGRVAPSAIFRGKRYQKFADAGGSMLFLASQGKPFQAAEIKSRFGRGKMARVAEAGHKIDQVAGAMSYLNTTSEIITRLSLVEKALHRIAQRDGMTKEQARRNKDSYEEAVAIARDYLDFGQGGSMVKAVDTFRPYTNAAFQVGRSMLKSWKRDWKHAAFQSGQVAALGALTALGKANYITEEDEDGITRSINRDISARDQARFFNIFPFGKEFWFEDEYGNRHRPYMKIPVDGLLIPPKILGEVAANMMAGEEIRGDVIREGMKAAAEPFGVGGGVGIPSLDAYFVMAHNLDIFFGGKVWPYSEYMEASKRVTKDTPQFFRDMSKFMNEMPGVNLSPKQFYEASRGIGAGGTWFTTMFGQAYENFRDVPQADRELILWEALADHPTTGGLISYTTPDVARYEMIEESEKEVITEKLEKKLHVTREAKRIREITRGEITSAIRPARLKKKVSDYIEAKAKDSDERKRLYEALEFYTEMPNTPRFSQWQSMTGKTPETKAKILKRMLKDAGPRTKEAIWNELKMFPQADGEGLYREFDRLTEQEYSR